MDLKVTMHGVVELHEMEQLLLHDESMLALRGFLLLLLDAADVAGMAMPARRLSAEWRKTHNVRFRYGVIGASFFGADGDGLDQSSGESFVE